MILSKKKSVFKFLLPPTSYHPFLFLLSPFSNKKKKIWKIKRPKTLRMLLKLVAVWFSWYFYSLIILVLVWIDLNEKDWAIKTVEMKVWRVLVFHPSCTLCCRKCEVFMSIHVRFDIKTLLELNEITDVPTLLLLIHTHWFLAASKKCLLYDCSCSLCQMETFVCTDMHVRAFVRVCCRGY